MFRRSVPAGILVAGMSLVPPLVSSSVALAAPLLRAADVTISLATPTSCEVRAVFTIEGAAPGGVEHRIHAPDGVDVELLTAGGVATPRSAVTRHGTTLAYTWVPDAGGGHPYELHYRVSQTDGFPYRCPIWLPAVPADGLSRSVRLEVHLPAGAVPRGRSLPAFAWSSTRGEARIRHLPAFVRVPHETPGYSPQGGAAWDLSALMDAVAIVILAGATGFWFWRRGRAERRTDAGPDAPPGSDRWSA